MHFYQSFQIRWVSVHKQYARWIIIHIVLFCLVWIFPTVPNRFVIHSLRIASMDLGQSFCCTRTREVTLTNEENPVSLKLHQM